MHSSAETQKKNYKEINENAVGKLYTKKKK